MYYSEEVISEVKRQNDIVDVIGQYVGLQHKGANYMCCCPFHSEKTPSFSVSPSKQMYKCFGCGEAGGVLTFVQKYENMSFPEAMQFLAQRAGITLPEEEVSEETKQKEQKRQRMFAVNKEAAGFYYKCLKSPNGEIGLNYFRKRGLSDETILKFGLGYSPSTGRDFINYLKAAGFSDQELMDAQLAGFSEKNGGLYPKFWNRVMFPILDVNNRVIGFGGRVMGDGEPKYLNSPETIIFDKSRNLYGLNYAKNSRKGNFILCEGYMDVIALHQAGFNQAVASLGTAFTPGQAFLIKKYVPDVYLSYDSDGAGIKAALRAIGILRNHNISPKIINMKPYKDPDEFIKNLGAEAYQERMDHAENFFMFQVRVAETKYDMSDPDGKTKFYREIANLLCDFAEDLERENYIQAVCEKYMIKTDDLRSMVGKSALTKTSVTVTERAISGTQEARRKNEMKFRDEQLLLTFLADDIRLYNKIKKYISAKDFLDETYQKIAGRFFDDLETGKTPDPSLLVCLVEDPEEQRKVSALFNTYLEEINTKSEKEKAFKDILISVKRKSYQFYSSQSGSDLEAINQSIAGRKALQELEKIKISFDE